MPGAPGGGRNGCCPPEGSVIIVVVLMENIRTNKAASGTYHNTCWEGVAGTYLGEVGGGLKCEKGNTRSKGVVRLEGNDPLTEGGHLTERHRGHSILGRRHVHVGALSG